MRTFPGCVVAGLAVVAAVGLTSCDPVVPDGDVDGTCDDPALAEQAHYDAEIQPLFDAYCTLCHSSERPAEGHDGRRGAIPGVDYDSLELSAAYPSLTWRRLADQTMPPMGAMPTTEELQSLLDFLNCAEAAGNAGDDDDSAL